MRDGATLFEGACFQGYCHHSAPNPNPTPQPVTEVPRQPKVTATKKVVGPKKPGHKPTASAQPAAGKSQKKVAASVITAATKPTTPVLVVPTNTLEEISDLLDRLPLQSCVELEPFTARVYMVVNRKSGLLAYGRELYTATHIRSTLFIDDLLPIRQWGRKRRSLCLYNF